MTASLEFSATDDAIALLEVALLTASAAERLHALVAVAWQMRQRDTQRALMLVEEAHKALALAGLSDPEQTRIKARLQLIRAEAQWLFGELDASKALAESALRDFASLQDGRGCADTHWLLAWLGQDKGDVARHGLELEAMVTAVNGIDPVRVVIAQAAIARTAAFRDIAATQEAWGAHFALDSSKLHPAAACWVEDFWGIVASLRSDYVQSIRHKGNSYALALATGQLRRAMAAALNTGDDFNSLHDYPAALKWMQCGLDMARPLGWPGVIGTALAQTANTLRGLHRYAAAADLLHEALDLLAPMSATRNCAIALLYLAEVELERRHYASALDHFRLLEQRVVALAQADLLAEAQCGQSQALLELGQPEQALQAAQEALAGDKLNATRQIRTLRVLADIHARHALPPPHGMTRANASLHYLHLAIDVAGSIENYTTPGDLLEALARAYAKLGDIGQAYELALQANQARETIHSQEASHRASAIQISHKTEKAREESEHQRQLAKAHAERANTLELANATLEVLGAVGREITTNLNATAIFAALETHVHGLLSATTLWVYQLEPDEQTLKLVFGVEAGQFVPAHVTRLDDNSRNVARCARERKEIIINTAQDSSATIAGTLGTSSQMYAPLMVGERLLGVMTVQSMLPHAYAEREVAIFRTLCAYSAIALANVDTQAQLVQAGKLASLGRLVAGVSHELNTPIGNALMAVTTLLDNLQAFQRNFAESGLKRQAFNEFMHAVGEGLTIALGSLNRSASLMQSFKQIAVDRAGASHGVFMLDDVLRVAADGFRSKLKETPYVLEVNAATGLQMDSFSDALLHALGHLLDNALVHGFAGRDAGRVSIDCQLVDSERVRILVKDNGHGIATEHQARIFDPFFTTRMGQHAGLGLYAAHNNVTQLLMGYLTLRSAPGEGSQFQILVPLTVPRPSVLP